MAYNLQISSKDLGLNFSVKYEKMDRAKKPVIEARNQGGEKISEHQKCNKCNEVLRKGDTSKGWFNKGNQQFGRTELTFWHEGQQVYENSQTKVFEIEGFQPLASYTDDYIVAKYYEIWESDNGLTKDFDRKAAESANRYQMRKLFEHLYEKNLVARGEFCPSSRGFVASDAYIRPIKKNGNKWDLEIGVFKEEKEFHHMQEGVPTKIAVPEKKKKIKMV